MRRIATGAVVALTMTLAACGGDEAGDAKAGGGAKATTTATAPAGALTLEQLRAKTDERCTAFTRQVLARPLPEGPGEWDAWNASLRQLERRLVDDLRALRPPRDQAAAYGRALDARERTLRRENRTIDAVERAASRLAPFSPHACRYWGIRAFGKDGIQFQGDQSSYCFEDAQKIADATARVKAGRSPAAAVRSVARTLERSARLMDVEPPGEGAEKRWDELRAAVDDLGETIEELPRLDTEAKADAFNEAMDSAITRAGTSTWTLGIGNCDFSEPMNDFVGAVEARGARRSGGGSGQAT